LTRAAAASLLGRKRKRAAATAKAEAEAEAALAHAHASLPSLWLPAAALAGAGAPAGPESGRSLLLGAYALTPLPFAEDGLALDTGRGSLMVAALALAHVRPAAAEEAAAGGGGGGGGGGDGERV
jgi:hypothetical protein